MKKIIITFFSLFIILLIVFNPFQSKKNVLKLIDESEIKNRINTIESKIIDYKKINSKNSYVNNFALEYDKEIILYEIKESLTKNLTSTEIDELLNWYESNLGKRITYLNSLDISKELAIKIINDIEPLKNKDRLFKVIRISDLLKYSESDYNIFWYLSKKVKSKIENSDLIKKRMRNQTIAYLMYKYRSLTENELDEYVSFLETASTKKFINLYKLVLSNSLMETFEVSN